MPSKTYLNNQGRKSNFRGTCLQIKLFSEFPPPASPLLWELRTVHLAPLSWDLLLWRVFRLRQPEHSVPPDLPEEDRMNPRLTKTLVYLKTLHLNSFHLIIKAQYNVICWHFIKVWKKVLNLWVTQDAWKVKKWTSCDSKLFFYNQFTTEFTVYYCNVPPQ